MTHDPTDEIFAELEATAAERAEREDPPIDPVLSGGLLPPESIEAVRARRAAEDAEAVAERDRFRREQLAYGLAWALVLQQGRRNRR